MCSRGRMAASRGRAAGRRAAGTPCRPQEVSAPRSSPLRWRSRRPLSEPQAMSSRMRSPVRRGGAAAPAKAGRAESPPPRGGSRQQPATERPDDRPDGTRPLQGLRRPAVVRIRFWHSRAVFRHLPADATGMPMSRAARSRKAYPVALAGWRAGAHNAASGSASRATPFWMSASMLSSA